MMLRRCLLTCILVIIEIELFLSLPLQQRYRITAIASASMPSRTDTTSAAMKATGDLVERDPEVWGIIKDEHDRQRKGIELIASENFISSAVMQVAASTEPYLFSNRRIIRF